MIIIYSSLCTAKKEKVSRFRTRQTDCTERDPANSRTVAGRLVCGTSPIHSFNHQPFVGRNKHGLSHDVINCTPSILGNRASAILSPRTLSLFLENKVNHGAFLNAFHGIQVQLQDSTNARHTGDDSEPFARPFIDTVVVVPASSLYFEISSLQLYSLCCSTLSAAYIHTHTHHQLQQLLNRLWCLARRHVANFLLSCVFHFFFYYCTCTAVLTNSVLLYHDTSLGGS